jgi:hypothetical protein
MVLADQVELFAPLQYGASDRWLLLSQFPKAPQRRAPLNALLIQRKQVSLECIQQLRANLAYHAEKVFPRCLSGFRLI